MWHSLLRAAVSFAWLYCGAMGRDPTPLVSELGTPTSRDPTARTFTLKNGECRWYQLKAASGGDVAENSLYTVTIKTPHTNTECAPGAWFVTGVPRSKGATKGSDLYCASEKGNAVVNPDSSKAWMKDVYQSQTNCMTQSQEMWFGFVNNCSSAPLEATILASRKNFCDEEKEKFYKLAFWLVLAGSCCFCTCCCMVVCRIVRARAENNQAESMGLSHMGDGSGYFVQGREGSNAQGVVGVAQMQRNTNPVSMKEWEANARKTDMDLEAGDEANRIKAAKWERKREEKRLRELKEQRAQAAAEQDAWERSTDSRKAEAADLDRRRQAARQAQDDAERAKRDAAQASREAREAKEAMDAAQNSGGGGEGNNQILADAEVEIRKAVDEAYTLQPAERKKKLRDLRMRWHPDKNPMLRSLADEISKIINVEIERCKKIHGD